MASDSNFRSAILTRKQADEALAHSARMKALLKRDPVRREPERRDQRSLKNHPDSPRAPR